MALFGHRLDPLPASQRADDVHAVHIRRPRAYLVRRETGKFSVSAVFCKFGPNVLDCLLCRAGSDL